MFLYVLLSILIVTIATGVVMYVYPENRWLRKITMVGLVLFVILTIFSVILGGIYSGGASDLNETYEDLMLYYNTVNYSNNEYVRYDYYDKVMAYNETFNAYQEASNGTWFGWLYPKDWDAHIGLIDFQLHGDEYVGQE